jgi:hypothetical protein
MELEVEEVKVNSLVALGYYCTTGIHDQSQTILAIS